MSLQGLDWKNKEKTQKFSLTGFLFVLWASALDMADLSLCPFFCGPHYSLCLTLQTYTAESRLGFWTSLVFQLAAVICQLSSWLLGATMTPQPILWILCPDSSHWEQVDFLLFLFFFFFFCLCLFVLEKRKDDSFPLSANVRPKVRKHTNRK